MLSIASPVWLAGLAVIPLIWWLHRLGEAGAAFPVSAVFLFRTPVAEEETQQEQPRANPLWILRAALLAALLLALAGLHWPHDAERHITVWFDNSLSMRVHEDAEPRSAMAARSLAAALEGVQPTQVRIRALSDHRIQLDLSEMDSERRATAIVEWEGSRSPGRPQIPFALVQATENWLLSDGADRRVNAWVDDTALARTIMVGSASENAAVTAITARRALQQNALFYAAVRINGLGEADSKRTLVVRADDQVILREDITVAAGGMAHRSFRVPTDAAGLTASLIPGDVLTLDDTMAVGLDALRSVAVDLDSRCGPSLRRALDVHPGLQLQAGSDRERDLTVTCTPTNDPLATASISVHAGNDYQPVTGTLQWRRRGAPRTGLSLQASWLLINADSTRRASPATLLSAPSMGRSLIDARPGAVDVFMDLEAASLVERLEYPLLVNRLVELTLADSVLDPVVRASRNVAESSIAGQPLPGGAAPAAAVQAMTDMAPTLLVLATLLLLADIFFALPVRTLTGRASQDIG